MTVLRVVYVPAHQSEPAPHHPFALQALASLVSLAAFGAMILAWSIGLAA